VTEEESQGLRLQGWLERLGAGDESALDELIRHVSDRLQRLTHQLLAGHPAVKRWAQTDDVLQGALMRLVRAVRNVRPASLRDFFALATQQIRWELIDLARHLYGPEGEGANHASASGSVPELADSSPDGAALAEWGELHRHIGELPEEQREVVGLLFYQGLSQQEAATLLGVAVRTVQRRWHAALVALQQSCHGEWPGG
jgi:RNA polymerase sigma-70 factor (ECF subfamily)